MHTDWRSTSTPSRTRTCCTAGPCRRPDGSTSTGRAGGREWPSAAACWSGRSPRSGGSGAAAGRVRPTTSTSPSAVAERLAGPLERQAELLPLLFPARVVADARVAELEQPLAGDDRVVAARVGAVHDDLGREVGHPLRAAQRLDARGRHVDRPG